MCRHDKEDEVIGELSHSSVIRQTVNVTAGTKTNLKLDTFGPGDLHAPPVVGVRKRSWTFFFIF